MLDPVTIDGVTIERAWITPRDTARVHLLPAFKAPICVVIVRRTSKRFHILKWDLRTNKLMPGSWFTGTIYSKRCDVSWDGQWMVYLALGADANKSWNGLCRPPWLKTMLHSPNSGTWAGGGVFTTERRLEANTHWHAESDLSQIGSPPSGIRITRLDSGGEDFPVLFKRLERDGWIRNGKHYGDEIELKSLKHTYANAYINDDGWVCQPTRKHPPLLMWYRGYLERGYTFEFRIESHPELLRTAEWACWSSGGDLLVADDGHLSRYKLGDLKTGEPSFSTDLNALTPPASS
ncbi:MAG: hypothetical protein AAGI68_15810 [Planctomycetota bacterium]